ncbi:hypothetical protein BD779DRAFT_1784843 [Infundibulicybe gibba]|nr:hypothetical protein BD779DRAFT_1784843 [Infundibulicybe gibba]
MIASRLSLYLVLFFTLTIAIAIPITRPGGKRTDVSDVEAVLKTLKTSTDSIFSEIGGATDATATPLVNNLTSAFNSATSSLSALRPVVASGLNEIAALMAGITSKLQARVRALKAFRLSLKNLKSRGYSRRAPPKLASNAPWSY